MRLTPPSAALFALAVSTAPFAAPTAAVAATSPGAQVAPDAEGTPGAQATQPAQIPASARATQAAQSLAGASATQAEPATPGGQATGAAQTTQAASGTGVFGGSKLLLTGGVSSIDGAAGGGLTPWAVVGSYATDGELGATAFVTRTRTQDYGLTVVGAAVGLRDRVEISFARQSFDADAAVPGATLRLDVLGLKVRVAGDAILDPDLWLPQIAVGIEAKHVDPGNSVGAVLNSVDAKRNGVDLYVNATKLLLGQGMLVNATLRATRANQNGLLGFGSSDRRGYHVKPEFSAAWLLRKDIAVGTEVRYKPDNLAFAGAPFREEAWKDVFVAWAPTKHFSATAAYVELGNIVGHAHQGGAYLSAQVGF